MINGDISNRKAPSILFRVEDFLVKYRETSTIDKVMNKLIGKHKRAELSEVVVEEIDVIFRMTDFTVGLVCMKEDWSKYPSDIRNIIIDALPITDVHLVHDYLDIKTLLDSGQYSFYVDDDRERQNLVGHKRCFTLRQIDTIVRKGYKYE